MELSELNVFLLYEIILKIEKVERVEGVEGVELLTGHCSTRYCSLLTADC